MDTRDMASRLEANLGLRNPPVGLTFVDEAPAEAAVSPGPRPSACSFWRDAERGTFYAPAQAHYACPVGSMVMGFELPGEVQQRLGELVGGMCDKQYLSAGEPARIPVVKTPHAGIVYGPLAASSGVPDVVLLWVTPRQAMLCNEAMGTADWTAGFPVTTGRPACAALPMAMAEGAPGMSFGCAGMRTFTEIGDDRMLVAIPGTALADFTAALDRIVTANSQMTDFYLGQRERIASGG